MAIFQALTGRRVVPPSPTAAFTDWIDRHRKIWFTLAALWLACSFNGQWHLGPDSAGYRQLAHNLATSGRYFFRADIPGVDQYHNEQGTRYPGLPIVLAVLERAFGQSPLPPLILMMLLATLTLVLVYHLLLFRVPRWVAVCVVVGVSTNPRFVQYANEILSDMPFLLGVIITLLGYEKVMHAQKRWPLALGVLITFIGLLTAAAMRPTFMMLAAALIASCLWGIGSGMIGLLRPRSASDSPAPAPVAPASFLTQPRSSIADDPAQPVVRWRSAMLVIALILAVLLFIGVIDIRSRQGGFLSGGYEERLVSKIENFPTKVAPLLAYNTAELLESALPMAVLGYRSGWGLIPIAGHHLGFGTAFSLIVLSSSVWLARRNMLWGLFVLVTIFALIFTGSVPRYFLMILPLLLTGWAIAIHALAQKFSSPALARFILFFGLFFLLASNVIGGSTFVLTQRGFTRPLDDHHHWEGVRYVGFLHAFDFGRWVGFDRLAIAVRRATSPHDKIIGPDASVLTFLCDRQVYEPIVSNRTKVAGKLFHLVIFPAEPDWHTSKLDYEQSLRQFLRTLHKQQGTILAGPEAHLQLATLAPIPAHRLTTAQRLEHARKMARHRAAAAAKAAAKTPSRASTHPLPGTTQ